MRLLNKAYRLTFHAAMLVAFILPLLSGCAQMGLSGQDQGMASTGTDSAASETASENQPYYPTDFNDLLIPGELTWNRENSMSIRTETFAGGILNFRGRVEVNSLTDFFINSMQKNGWKMAGSVKYKNVMLAFTKPYKTCMFSISEKGFGTNTEVYVYITEDISARKTAQTTESGL